MDSIRLNTLTIMCVTHAVKSTTYPRNLTKINQPRIERTNYEIRNNTPIRFGNRQTS